MIDRTSMLAGAYMLPPGNGHPELHLDPLDPIDFVSREIAARNPDVQGTLDKIKEEMGKDRAPAVQDALKKALGYEDVKKDIKGLAAAAALAVVGIIAIIFGGYLLTKE